MGLAFRLLISDSIRFSSSVVENLPIEDRSSKREPPVVYSLPFEESDANDFPAKETQSSVSIINFLYKENQTSQTKECDLFTGDWVADPSGPFYANGSCTEIEGHQNCMRNGRPDSGYLYWRWNALGCDLPKFNPHRFLNLMSNKSWAFIGDSISRNHVQSLLCILSQLVFMIGALLFRRFSCLFPSWFTYRTLLGALRWNRPLRFITARNLDRKYGISSSQLHPLSVIWTPFLIKADIFEDMNGVSSSEIQLHLDKLDRKWADQYRNYDYAVIAGGKWFLKTAIYHENNTVTGCHYCPGKNLTELGFDYAYRKALQLIFNFLTHSGHKAFIFFRTTTPDHFENGEWFSGGTCNRTVPFKKGEIDMRDVDTTMRNIELEEFEKAAAIGSDKGLILKLLDTTRVSLLRPDGHPGPYRQFQPFAEDENAKVRNDCLHWCLPGPIDS